jgi:hypothetical protein
MNVWTRLVGDHGYNVSEVLHKIRRERCSRCYLVVAFDRSAELVLANVGSINAADIVCEKS